MTDKVTVVVRHRVRGQGWVITRLRFPLPENIDPENVDSFLAAMILKTATTHNERRFGVINPLLMQGLRTQILTGLLTRAEAGPHRRLAARLLRVMRLSDIQLLEQHSVLQPLNENRG